MSFRNLLLSLTASLAALPLCASPAEPVREMYPASAVRLTAGRFKKAQEMDIRYLLSLDPDRLLAPYLKEAGLAPKADNYTNWENTGLDGHIGGHYLSALSYMYAATGDKEIKQRLDYMLSELRRAQDAAGDGYLCGVPGGRRIWAEIASGDIRAGGFSLNGGWVPLYNIHKIFNGLKDAWTQTGSTEARDMLVALTDWMDRLTSGLTDAQIQEMLASEHGGLNETFADVAAITGDSRYISLARRFSHRALLDPLLAREDRLTGMHANTQIPKVIGFKRIADISGDKSWSEAAEYFWDNVTSGRSISIGGNSVREHFHQTDDFSPMLTSEQGPETCNTYNMLRLCKMLYETSADPAYLDFYERALYNHILSSINPVQGGFVYFTPMRPGHYRVYSQPQTSFWCCVGSGMENHARYGEAIYSHSADTVGINLYIPSVLTTDFAVIEQETDFPESETVTVRLSPVKDKARFTLAMRIPGWTDPSAVELAVNGHKTPAAVRGGFASVSRKWAAGDSVTLRLPMSLRAECLPDSSGYVSFLYGPMVLGAETGRERQDGLFADDSRGGHIAAGPFIPAHSLPAIIEDGGDPLSHVAPASKPLEFKLTGLSQKHREGMTLRPFADLHECRYMVYFPVYGKEEWQAISDSIARTEAERIRLDAMTADVVVCGEQKPESDHAVSLDRSEAGYDSGAHWREARGAFGYTLRTGGKTGGRLRLTFLPDMNRKAAITVDGKRAGLAGTADGWPSTAEIPLPEGAGKDGSVKVEITPDNCPVTPRFLEVRLISAPGE
ncbi:MAG: glycoside hydrolase family 127 protein [Duncaniella sp.]|nr:glycoside hydrolase family 127 protein [Duncaniella sp.]